MFACHSLESTFRPSPWLQHLKQKTFRRRNFKLSFIKNCNEINFISKVNFRPHYVNIWLFFDRVTFPSTWKNAVFAPKNLIIISSFALPSSARVPFTSRHFLSLHEKSAHPLFWKQKFFFCCRFSQLRKQGAREMRNDCSVLIREFRLMKKLRNCGSTKANNIRSHILLFMSMLEESND